MATGFRAVVISGAADVVDLGQSVTSASWTTNALGGFGSASFTLPGDPSYWLPKTPKLALVRLTQDELIVFEGQIEDHDYTVSDGEMSTTVQCFGLARALDELNMHRVWLKRDVEFLEGQLSTWTPDPAFDVQTGNFDPTDLTKSGIRFMGNNTASVGTPGGKYRYWRIKAPPGLTLVACRGAYQKAGNANIHAQIYSSPDYVNYTNALDTTVNATTTFDIATVANAVDVLFGCVTTAAITPTSADFVQFYGVLVESVSPTVSGVEYNGVAGDGFAVFGGWVLKEMHTYLASANVGWPLTAGQIDLGTEFAIQQIEGGLTSFVRDVVEEVASYYTKEWQVWEGGRFDWKEINLDYVHWIIDVSELTSLNLRSSVDEISSLEVVVYNDAASGFESSVSAASTSRANPYVVRGRRKDKVTSPGFPMTSNTAGQLASRLAAARGIEAFASGTCSLGYRTPVTKGRGSAAPAFQIRSGQNIKITGLPKSNPFDTGRDGETLFHVVSTETALDGTVTLTLDSQEHAIDALLARLAAVTRTLTG